MKVRVIKENLQLNITFQTGTELIVDDKVGEELIQRGDAQELFDPPHQSSLPGETDTTKLNVKTLDDVERLFR